MKPVIVRDKCEACHWLEMVVSSWWRAFCIYMNIFLLIFFFEPSLIYGKIRHWISKKCSPTLNVNKE